MFLLSTYINCSVEHLGQIEHKKLILNSFNRYVYDSLCYDWCKSVSFQLARFLTTYIMVPYRKKYNTALITRTDVGVLLDKMCEAILLTMNGIVRRRRN